MKALRAAGAAVGLGAMSLACLVLGLPLLAVSGGGFGDSTDACLPGQPPAADASPTILGRSALTHAELSAWWRAEGRAQPPALALPVEEAMRHYLEEADAEGLRGDIAFAQAIHETGWFTSNDTTINNFAGIAHYDGHARGRPFANAPTGIRAHIQLLKKYAAGNDTLLVHPDVAPDAGAHATTWAQLAGTWATAPNYWTAISSLYTDMLASTGRSSAPPRPDDCPPTATSPAEDGLVEVGGITVDASIATQLDRLLAVARRDGLTLTGNGYRSHARQIELRRAHCGTTHYDIYEAPASACSPPTARPGTSRHEQGLAIDFNNCSTRSTRCWQWLNVNAAAFGFHNLPSEPWHWSIDGT